jgi:hypothetical protein
VTSGELLPLEMDERRFFNFLADGKTLFCVTQEKAEFWDPEEGQRKRELDLIGGHRDASVRELSVCVEKNCFATAAGDRVVLVRNLQSGRIQRVLWHPTMDLRGVALTPDGHWLAAAADQATLLCELHASTSAPPAEAPQPQGSVRPASGTATGR